MNWPRIILDGLSMSLLFNAVAGLGFLLVPQAYSTMFPKEIRRAAAPFVEKKDVRTMKLILYPLYPMLFVYWAVSAHFAGMTGSKSAKKGSNTESPNVCTSKCSRPTASAVCAGSSA